MKDEVGQIYAKWWMIRKHQPRLCPEYMETKRLAFPRFYFVSSADLLDILSNGNQPEMVAKHLTKLFDSMAKLSFEKDADGKKRR